MLHHKLCKVFVLLLLCGGSTRVLLVSNETSPPHWVAGDCSFDGRANLIDVLYLLEHLFGESGSFLCEPLCDLDGDRRLSLGDVTWLLAGLFREANLLAPWAPQEFCDGIDNDCDGNLDEGCLEGIGVSITLCWDPVSTDEEGNSLYVAGYRVHLGTTSGVYSAVVDVGLLTCVRLVQLQPSTTYYLAVTAYNIQGVESKISSEIAAAPSE